MLGLWAFMVGKTTLLAQLNKKFSEVRDLVIFVVVASIKMDKLQDEIGSRLGISGESS